MRVLVIGASGFIGGAVSQVLLRAGHAVYALARNPARHGALAKAGLAVCPGALDDAPSVIRAIEPVDAVINAADSDHAAGVQAILGAIERTGKIFIHTSGISVTADRAAGAAGGAILDETTAYEPLPERAARHAIDIAVQDAGRRGSRTVVMCCPLIYGPPAWPGRESVQVPHLVKDACECGVARYVGAGLARWSRCHVEDIAAAYKAALARPVPGALYYPESGEMSWGELAHRIGRVLGVPAGSFSLDEAVGAWGPRALWTYCSNARTRGVRIRADLGWAPKVDALEAKNDALEEDIRRLAAMQARGGVLE
jgi:nucleoside-diphosphate-sugar epimerase